MTAQDKMRLRQIRAKINKNVVIYEDEVIELRELESKAAEDFVKRYKNKMARLRKERRDNNEKA